MKIVALSDTHGQHAAVQLPEADMIIHAGDLTKKGSVDQVKDFLHWFSGLNYRYKVFIAGNHDFWFEHATGPELKMTIPDNLIYLNDSGVEIEGIKFWGSPVTPWFMDWAFNRARGEEIRRHWQMIPQGTDVLITHGPPAGILDRTMRNGRVGCQDLLDTVREVKPTYNIFGHIHEAYGIDVELGTTFINASVLDVNYQMFNDPVAFEYVKVSTTG